MRSYTEIPILHNIPVLVRAALNVPVENGRVTQEFRLRRALPTIKYLCERGARVILIGHIGDKGIETLSPVVAALGKLLGPVSFCEFITGSKAREAVRALTPGGVLVLENLRRNAGEVGADREFARELASLADVFVQDSFDVCHRPHASIVRVPELLPSYAGWELLEEVRELSKALKPESPSLAIVGGAKFSTKEPVLLRLLELYDHVFVGGALANDFLKEKGVDVGESLVSEGSSERVRQLIAHPRLVIPSDTRIHDGRIEDVGQKSAELLALLARQSKTVLWNGPLGEYEKGFTESTDIVAQAIAESDAYSIVGGGDTVARLERLNLVDRFSFVSIGGGAMLEFLAKGSLPGIAALG